MTNPQRENGHIEINNENAEQFAKLHLSGNEWQIIWVILRKTWGWNKKEDSISLTQFENLTALSRPSVKEAIDKLVGKKVLVVKKELYINSYNFNKLYNEWIVPKKVLVGFSVKDSRVFGKKLVPKKEHTIDNNKRQYTKDNINSIIPFFEKVNPSYKRMFSNTNQRASLQRLVDQYGEERIKNLLLQLPSIIQRPYAPRITTPYELEAKMGQLIAFMKQESIKINKGGVTKV